MFLRDRKLGTTYSLDSEWYEFTDILLRNLKDRFTDVNFIGFRVLESRDAGAFIRRYCGYFGKEFESTMQDWKKKRAFTISNSGYAAYFDCLQMLWHKTLTLKYLIAQLRLKLRVLL